MTQDFADSPNTMSMPDSSVPCRRFRGCSQHCQHGGQAQAHRNAIHRRFERGFSRGECFDARKHDAVGDDQRDKDASTTYSEYM